MIEPKARYLQFSVAVKGVRRSHIVTTSLGQREGLVPVELEFLPTGYGQGPPAGLQTAGLATLIADGAARILLISCNGGMVMTNLAFAIDRRWLAGEPGEVLRIPVLIETGLRRGEAWPRGARLAV